MTIVVTKTKTITKNRKVKNDVAKRTRTATVTTAMTKASRLAGKTKAVTNDSLRVVVIGSGPTGQQFIKEFLKNNPNAIITHYGDQPRMPYKHGLLFSFLQGTTTLNDVMENSIIQSSNVITRFGVGIRKISTERNLLLDNEGNLVEYDKLVIATGSYTEQVELPGSSHAGVFKLNNLDDVLRLHARKARTSHTVVIGCGDLELEAAKGMQSSRTRVTVINQGKHLQPNQLNTESACKLQNTLELNGLKFRSSSKVVRILGDKTVVGVQLDTGSILLCDTVIMAANTKPSVDFARSANLYVKEGVVVNDFMQTSNPDIYAIGKCAQYENKTTQYFDQFIGQASVAAWHLAN